MSTLTVCRSETPREFQATFQFSPVDSRDDAKAASENALLQSLVTRRRQAIADNEAAYQSKLDAQRDAERQRLNDVLARVLDRHGVGAAG